MADDWLRRHSLLTRKNAKLEEINYIVRDYISGEMRPFPSADTLENENEPALRYSIKMLNTLSHGAPLPITCSVSRMDSYLCFSKA